MFYYKQQQQQQIQVKFSFSVCTGLVAWHANIITSRVRKKKQSFVVFAVEMTTFNKQSHKAVLYTNY